MSSYDIKYDEITCSNWRVDHRRYEVTSSTQFAYIVVSEVTMPDGFKIDYPKGKVPLPYVFTVSYNPFVNGEHVHKPGSYMIHLEGMKYGNEKECQLRLAVPVRIEADTEDKMIRKFASYDERTLQDGKKGAIGYQLVLNNEFRYCKVLEIKTPQNFKVDCVMEKSTIPFHFKITYEPFQNKQFVGNPGSHEIQIEVIAYNETQERRCLTIPIVVERDLSEKYDAYACSVCMFSFSDVIDKRKPKTLPACGHTACSGCMGEVFDRKSENERKKDEFICFKCRKVSKYSKIPFNHSMIEAIRAEKKEVTVLEKTERVFKPIVECFENEYHESTVYCEDCPGTYCKNCFDQVHSIKKIREHRGIPLKDRPAITPNCNTHPDVLGKYYCQSATCSDNRVACTRCRNGVHKKHSGKRIDELIQENEEKLIEYSKSISELHSAICALIQKAGTCIKSFGSNSDFGQEKQHMDQIHRYYLEKDACSRRMAYDDYGKFLQQETNEMTSMRDMFIERRETLKNVLSKIKLELQRKNNIHNAGGLIAEAEEELKWDISNEEFFFELKDYFFDPSMEMMPSKPMRVKEVPVGAGPAAPDQAAPGQAAPNPPAPALPAPGQAAPGLIAPDPVAPGPIAPVPPAPGQAAPGPIAPNPIARGRELFDLFFGDQAAPGQDDLDVIILDPPAPGQAPGLIAPDPIAPGPIDPFPPRRIFRAPDAPFQAPGPIAPRPIFPRQAAPGPIVPRQPVPLLRRHAVPDPVLWDPIFPDPNAPHFMGPDLEAHRNVDILLQVALDMDPNDPGPFFPNPAAPGQDAE